MRAWEAQLPAGQIIRFGEVDTGMPNSFPNRVRIIIVDQPLIHCLPPEAEWDSYIVAGDIDDTDLRNLKKERRGVIAMSYEESRLHLGDIAVLCAEHGEMRRIVKHAGVSTRARDQRKLNETVASELSPGKEDQIWCIIGEMLERVESKNELVEEFGRGYRYLLGCSKAFVLLREGNEYVYQKESRKILRGDPLVETLESSPVILDGKNWPEDCDIVSELSIRNTMALWNCRLLVPLHDSGTLIGIVACGVRNDGCSYDSQERTIAVRLAMILVMLLRLNCSVSFLTAENVKGTMRRRYFPNAIILEENEAPPYGVPLVIRMLISKIRNERCTQTVTPIMDHPFRGKGGIVRESGGVWVFWEEASAEIYEQESRDRAERIELLRELSLTLNHELGNALVSLTMLLEPHSMIAKPLQRPVLEDVERLKALNDQIAELIGIAELHPEEIDIRGLITALGEKYSILTEIGSEPVRLYVVPRLIEIALEAVIAALVEARGNLTSSGLILQVRTAGAGASLVALISVKGSRLELDGIIPPSSMTDTPNHGRMGLFIAKEILRLHHGSMRSGPGLEGAEILISLRRW